MNTVKQKNMRTEHEIMLTGIVDILWHSRWALEHPDCFHLIFLIASDSRVADELLDYARNFFPQYFGPPQDPKQEIENR